MAYRQNPAPRSAPPRLEIDFADLPAPSQELLRAVSRAGDNPRKLERTSSALAVLAIAAGLLVIVVPAAMTAGVTETLHADGRPPWDTSQLGIVTAACFAAGLLLAGGIAERVRAGRSPLGAFFYVHPAYLLDVRYRRIVAYPLAQLADRELSGQSVDLSFGEHEARLTFDTPGEAGQFLQIVVAGAKAASAPPPEDADPVEGPDFIPEALRGPSAPAPAWRRPEVLPVAAALVLGLAGRLGLPSLHASLAESRMFAACVAESKACKDYLVTFPSGAHRDEADDRLFWGALTPERLDEYGALLPAGRHRDDLAKTSTRRIEDALEHVHRDAAYSTREGEEGGVEALLTTLNELRRNREHTLYLLVRSSADPSISANRPGYQADQLRPIAPPALSGLDGEQTDLAAKSIREAVQIASGGSAVEVLHLGNERDLPAGAAAVLDAEIELVPGRRVYGKPQSGTGDYLEILARCTLTFRWPKKVDSAGVRLHLESGPGDRISTWTRESTAVYQMMVTFDMLHVRPQLSRALGVAGAHDDE